MPSPTMLMHLALDFITRQEQARTPEPELVMVEEQAEAFTRAGREDGILAHTYIYHALQISALVRPGHVVLDLGCGPANQLVQIARLNPETQFIGIDASSSMLALASQTIERCGLQNVVLQAGNMESLEGFSDGAVDGVFSTMSLHHLADTASLNKSFQEIRRVLKPKGALYLADFGRLKRKESQHFFAEDRKAIQPEVFTVDYFNSLCAAFSLQEVTAAAEVFGDEAKVYKTFLVPFLFAIKSPVRQALNASQQATARAMYAGLTRTQRWDLRDLSRFFGHGGLPLVFKPW